ITHIHVIITLDTLVDNLVTIDFDVRSPSPLISKLISPKLVHNPLDTDLVIEFVQSDGTLNGTTWAQFGHAFSNFVVPAGQTVNSGPFPNVLLTQGAIPSLDIIPLGILDVSAASTLRVGGPGGYQVPWLKINQKSVPTSY
ncbi:hypothetical protein BDZ94DRAFT_1133976, partial [Collybia nuda]